ncbi:hypothetical protein B0H14DRAFT_3575537 [Mycena olivaceomarginata]|nr:hypothetical protein B0H14DRAFT_3575537 [Mycena olivaceomarginata]
MDEYIAQLKIAVANLLDAFDAVDPMRILMTSDDLDQAFANRLAPSRDISLKFAAMDRVKHVLCGGYWKDHTSKQWIQAGGAVQKCSSVIWDGLPHAEIDPGKIKPQAAGKNPVVRWEETVASRFWTEKNAPVPDSQWKKGSSASTDSGDNAPLGSWVFCRDSGGKTIIGEEELTTRDADSGWGLVAGRI